MKTVKKLMQNCISNLFSLVCQQQVQYWRMMLIQKVGNLFQENGRTYYKKGDIKETDWRVIDGKTYYFDYNGEMVVGWQYIPMPVKDIQLVLILMV